MGPRYADKNIGPYGTDTFQQVFITHTRINKNDYRSDLEKRKGEGNKFDGRRDHQHHPVTFHDAHACQAVSKTVGDIIHFSESP